MNLFATVPEAKLTTLPGPGTAYGSIGVYAGDSYTNLYAPFLPGPINQNHHISDSGASSSASLSGTFNATGGNFSGSGMASSPLTESSSASSSFFIEFDVSRVTRYRLSGSATKEASGNCLVRLRDLARGHSLYYQPSLVGTVDITGVLDCAPHRLEIYGVAHSGTFNDGSQFPGNASFSFNIDLELLPGVP